MARVDVSLNGHTYSLACDDGEEDRIRELGVFLESRVRGLESSIGHVGDTRLLLMAGLTIADELEESLARVEEKESEIAALNSRLPAAEAAGAEALAAGEDRLAEVLDDAAQRIEAIAAKVARA